MPRSERPPTRLGTIIDRLSRRVQKFVLLDEHHQPLDNYWQQVSKEQDAQASTRIFAFVDPLISRISRNTQKIFAGAYYGPEEEAILRSIDTLLDQNNLHFYNNHRAQIGTEPPIYTLQTASYPVDNKQHTLSVRWNMKDQRPVSLAFDLHHTQGDEVMVTGGDMLFLPHKPESATEAALLIAQEEFRVIHGIQMTYSLSYEGFRRDIRGERSIHYNYVGDYPDPATKASYRMYANIVTPDSY